MFFSGSGTWIRTKIDGFPPAKTSAGEGIEPSLVDSESTVLPLDDPATALAGRQSPLSYFPAYGGPLDDPGII